MRRLCLALCALVAAVCLPSTAVAAPLTPPLWRAYNVAATYWSAEPVQCRSLDAQIVPRGELGAGIGGRATQPYPGWSGPCILYIDRAYAKPVEWATACAIMIHEYGHLLGYAHSTAGIMQPSLYKVPGICTRNVRI